MGGVGGVGNGERQRRLSSLQEELSNQIDFL